uniref:Cilia- and flagella-associated protein 157 n=1 Tax=Mesocestoides corti TaxID=53468 RepID=A0A5K3EWM1_MESCO
NKENKILINEYENLRRLVQSSEDECICLRQRIQAMQTHEEEVRQTTVAVNAMLKTFSENLETEFNLASLAEREREGLLNDISKVTTQTRKMQNKISVFEASNRLRG